MYKDTVTAERITFSKFKIKNMQKYKYFLIGYTVVIVSAALIHKVNDTRKENKPNIKVI